MGVPTHVMQFSSGRAAVNDGGSSLSQFVSPLRQLDGTERWFITFYALPEGKSFDDVRGQATEQFIQAAGRSDAMTVEIRKLAAGQSRVGWIRYTVGHEYDGTLPLDVAIPLPKGDQMISQAEVFDADEAGDLFYTYYRTGDIPHGYALRPVEGYTAEGDIVDLQGTAQ